MGIKLQNPIIVASCDLTSSVEGIVKCQEAGAGAVVLKSIFEEQFYLRENLVEEKRLIHPEAMDYLKSGGLLEYAPRSLSRLIEEAKKRVKIPLIASINCRSSRHWPIFARELQYSGVDGLELNVYFLPLNLDYPSTYYEKQYLEIIKEVKKSVSIPVSIKLSSQITSLPYLVNELARRGCDAVVLFNWFMEPYLNIKKLKIRNKRGKSNFSTSLRWVGLLSGRVSCDIASSGGVEDFSGVVKQLLAGASAVQICSLFYKKGLKEIKNLLEGIRRWMEEMKFSSLDDFRGELSFKRQELSFKGAGEAEGYFRVQYMKVFSKFI